MGRASKYSPELRERAVRLVQEHTAKHGSQWAAIRSVGEKLGLQRRGARRYGAGSDRSGAMPASEAKASTEIDVR
jgi:transposase-like protein